MDKIQLKNILKPLIKEILHEGLKEEQSFVRSIIREIIFEDGTISKLISEAVRGLGSSNVVLEETPQRKISKPKNAVQVLGHLTPETTLEEDEIIAEQEKKKRSKARESLESDRKELLAHAAARAKTMERMLNSTGVPMEIFESVDVNSLPAPPSLSVGSRNKAGGVADLGVAPRTKGDGNAAMPLRGISPNDAGIPITGILNLVGGAKKWTNQLTNS